MTPPSSSPESAKALWYRYCEIVDGLACEEKISKLAVSPIALSKLVSEEREAAAREEREACAREVMTFGSSVSESRQLLVLSIAASIRSRSAPGKGEEDGG